MDAERIEQRRLGPGPTWAIWQCLDSPRDATVGQILSGALAELGACLQGKADIIAATLTHPDEESSRALAYRANRPADGFVVLAYKNNVAVFYSVDRLGGPKEDSGYVFSGQAYAAGSGVPGLIQTMERAGRTVLRLDVPRCLLNIFVDGAVELDRALSEIEVRLLRSLLLTELSRRPLDGSSGSGFHERNN